MDKKLLHKAKILLALWTDLNSLMRMYEEELISNHDVDSKRIVDSILYRVQDKMYRFDDE